MKVNPWETPQGKKVWKTKSQFMNYVRGGIRKAIWMRNPLKIQFLLENRKRVPLGRKTVPNPEGLVWGAECSICNNDFKQSEVQVDHLRGNNKLTDVEDLQEFMEAMIFIDPDKDLSIVCVPCHKIKTLADSKGISFEEARIEKQTIEITKGKPKEWLEERGIKPATNAKLRRAQIKESLINDKS